MAENYRANVAGILRNDKGKILVCERLKQADSWQFPQGGLDQGEKALEGLYRELKEEIGISNELYTVTLSHSGYRYLYPEGRNKSGYHGQEQTYYLCDFHGNSKDICIETDHPEFRATRWIKPKDFDLSWIPNFKRDVYQQVLIDFFGIDLSKHR